MKDITNCKKGIGTYGGSEIKMTYYIDGKKHMVKFPDPTSKRNGTVFFANNQYSEYVGCMIFKLFGIDTQDVELVKCNIDGKDKIAVACLDFLKDDEILIELKIFSYSLNAEKKYTSAIEDIYEMISLMPNLDNREGFIEEFWKRFIVDTLIGNVDRHLGNWGFIEKNDELFLSPVYDCGSCLNPLLSEDEMKNILTNSTELKNVAYNVKTAYRLNGKAVSYSDVYKIMPNDLAKQLRNVYPMIDMDKIKKVIYGIPCLSDIQKEFYYKTIKIRKESIVDVAYKKLKA